MTRETSKRFARAILASVAGLAASAAWFTYLGLSEAFGPGPPYFGRTENMDKWQNPLPGIVASNALALLVCVALLLVRSSVLNRAAAQPTTKEANGDEVPRD